MLSLVLRKFPPNTWKQRFVPWLWLVLTLKGSMNSTHTLTRRMSMRSRALVEAPVFLLATPPKPGTFWSKSWPPRIMLVRASTTNLPESLKKHPEMYTFLIEKEQDDREIKILELPNRSKTISPRLSIQDMNEANNRYLCVVNFHIKFDWSVIFSSTFQ